MNPGFLAAQHSVRIGFYNVENLYDTVPSPFYNDKDYTPGGRMNWNTERYTSKISNISAVLEDLSADIVALAEIENEAVLHDLIRAMDNGYNYIHRHTNDRRGMDMALLYRGDKFIPDTVTQIDSGTSRAFLYVCGHLLGERIDLMVCHMPSQLNKRHMRINALRRLEYCVDSLRRRDPNMRLIVLGDFNAPVGARTLTEHLTEPAQLKSLLSGPAFRGAGTYAYKGRWQILDHIYITPGINNDRRFRTRDAGIFVKDYMVHHEGAGRTGYPRRTFTGRRWLNGYSDHYPVYFTLEIYPDSYFTEGR